LGPGPASTNAINTLENHMNHRSYYLELFKVNYSSNPSLAIESSQILRLSVSDYERCRYLWTKTDEGFWLERSDWSSEQWKNYLKRTDIAFFAYACNGCDRGFFEFSKAGNEVKIEGFGLLEEFRGIELGIPLLSAAVNRAFDWQVERIWLHTATDDHQNALPTYKKLGFKIYREEELKNPVPTRS